MQTLSKAASFAPQISCNENIQPQRGNPDEAPDQLARLSFLLRVNSRRDVVAPSATLRADLPPDVAPSAWQEAEDGSVVLGAFKYSQDAVVPAPPAGKRAAIGPGRFSEYPDDAIEWEVVEIETVVLPDGIQTIGVGAFTHCAKLRSIRFPNDLETIEERAFKECVSLKTVALPDGLEHIGKNAFQYCRFETATFPDGLQRIGPGAFASCRFKEITLPNGVESGGSGAFRRCRALTKITLPPRLETLGDRAFGYCQSPSSATISSYLKFSGPRAFPFASCNALHAVTFPSGRQTKLGDWLREVWRRQDAESNAPTND